MALDAYGGGRLAPPFFNINNDLSINEGDLINIGSLNNPVWVVPSGWSKTGIYYPPAVLSLPSGLERSYYSTSAGVIDTSTHKGENLGVTTWREIE